jgi:hypothetical protein
VWTPGHVRHRAKVVEYGVEQHANALYERLAAVARVTARVTTEIDQQPTLVKLLGDNAPVAQVDRAAAF